MSILETLSTLFRRRARAAHGGMPFAVRRLLSAGGALGSWAQIRRHWLPAAFRSGCVARRSNAPGIFASRALRDGRF